MKTDTCTYCNRGLEENSYNLIKRHYQSYAGENYNPGVLWLH
jgi:hypothetical protein